MRGRLLVAASVLFGALVMPGAAHASPPSNDNFTFARGIDVAIADSWVFGSDTVDMTGATLEAGEPTSCSPTADHSVWYRFDPAVDEAYDGGLPAGQPVEIDAYAHDRIFASPVLAVYDGSGSLDGLHQLACGNAIHLGGAFSGANWTKVTAWRNPGATLWVQVLTRSDDYQTIDVSMVKTTNGDDRRRPAVLQPTASVIGTSFVDDVARTTRQPGDPSPSCAPAGNNEWLQLTPATSGKLSIDASVTYPVHGYLAIYRATSEQLVEIACTPISEITTTIVITADVLADYRFELSGNSYGTSYPSSGSITITPAG